MIAKNEGNTILDTFSLAAMATSVIAAACFLLTSIPV